MVLEALYKKLKYPKQLMCGAHEFRRTLRSNLKKSSNLILTRSIGNRKKLTSLSFTFLGQLVDDNDGEDDSDSSFKTDADDDDDDEDDEDNND